MAKGHEEHRVKIQKSEHLDSLLVQAYAVEIIEYGCDYDKFVETRNRLWGKVKGEAAEAVCFSFSSDSSPADWMDNDLMDNDTLFVAGDEEEADRVARAFDKPMLTYDGFRGGQTCELLRQLLGIRKANVTAGVSDALFYGDVAMLCYGIRKARQGHVDAILLDNKPLKKKQRERLTKSGIRASSVSEWQRDNSVLTHYHGVDMAGVAEKGHVYFMGLMIPPARVSLNISRARTGGSESDVQLLDSLLLKALVDTAQPLPCLFGDIAPDESLSYSPRLGKLRDAYLGSREKVKKMVCEDTETNLGFDVRTPDPTWDAIKELKHARQVQEAVKGMPVIPMYYGLLDCGKGEVQLAVESFDMTLETWSKKERTLPDWLEVLSRTAWCVVALDTVAGMAHAALDASHVLVRNSEGKKRKAVPVRLKGESMPHGNWDVRLSGVDKIMPGRDESGLQKVATQILAARGLALPEGIRNVLQNIKRASIEGTVKLLARQLVLVRGARPAPVKKPQ